MKKLIPLFFLYSIVLCSQEINTNICFLKIRSLPIQKVNSFPKNYNFFIIKNIKPRIIEKSWKVTGKYTFLFNQSSFSNWSAGGNNTVAGNMGLSYDFNYKKNKWNWDNKLTSFYGLSYVDRQGIRKTDDRIEYNSLLGKKTSKLWFFSFFSNFKTQYSKGYEYKEDMVVEVSDFFSPAYWSFGPGMLWKKSDDNRINIAPATVRYTFVSDKFSGKYGVENNRNTKFGLGLNFSSYFKHEIMKDVVMENIIAVYSDYLNKAQNIDVDYQLSFYIIINKYLSTNLGLHAIIDDDASSKIQFKEVFGLGLNYIFHKT
jgi:hypothetical protein